MKKPLQVALISPRSLAPYAELLTAGFNAIKRAMPARVDEFESFVPAPDESASDFRARVQKVIHRFHAVIIQLHGSHTEAPIAFEDFGLILTRRILLVHRPEEVLERQRQGLYPYDFDRLLRRFDCTVLLGQAMQGAYEKRGCQVAVIPHGFSQIRPVRARSFGIGCVGAVTGFGDMRWLADALSLHRTYLAQRTHEKLLFYMAGTFTPFQLPGRESPIDELGELCVQAARDPHCRVRILPTTELERAYTVGEFNDLETLRSWAYAYADAGQKILVVTGSLTVEPLRRLQTNLLDFNVQLYRELLRDFQPKVEYSGSLHKAPGSQIPIVWDSPSMDDVSQEGLTHMIKIRQQGSSANYAACMRQILAYMADPRLFNEHRATMCGQAAPLTFAAIARRYLSLITALDDHQRRPAQDLCRLPRQPNPPHSL